MNNRRKEAIARTDTSLRLLRCFEHVVRSFMHTRPLPLALLYYRAKVYYKLADVASTGGSPSFLKTTTTTTTPKSMATTLTQTSLPTATAAAAGVASTTTIAAGPEHTTSSSTIASLSMGHHESNIYLFDAPIDDPLVYSRTLNNFEYLNSDLVLDKHVVKYLVSNSCMRITPLGKWILITKIRRNGPSSQQSVEELRPPRWLLKYRYGGGEQPVRLVEVVGGASGESGDTTGMAAAAAAPGRKGREWLAFVEASYNLVKENDEGGGGNDDAADLVADDRFRPNMALMRSLSQNLPNGWSLEHDEDLADLLKDVVNTDVPGSVRNLVKSISLSTQRTPEDVDALVNLDNRRTYWESEAYSASSYCGYNAIRIYLKPLKRIKRLYIVINKKYRQHMPKDVVVMGGTSPEDLAELGKTSIRMHEDGDVLILENCYQCYSYIEIRIKTCQKSGTDCRVYGLKMFTSVEDDSDVMPSEMFLSNKLASTYPRLSTFPPTFLYRRAEALLRFINLFDICMNSMLPAWDYSDYFQSMIKSVKKLLVLSSRRLVLLERILADIPTTDCFLPLIYIDRPLAFAHRGRPALDPNYQNTIFMQIFNNLSRTYSFRWEKTVDQWWECKFIGEGIIDQGGGFRDSLSDIADELCPNTGLGSPIPLPFFIRSPNQLQADSNTFRDTFVPNPSCMLNDEYEFIGKLMGACMRSKTETLALYLAPFFWKRLSAERVSWRSDFLSVDAAQVKFLDGVEKASLDEYEATYAGELKWSCTLSNGQLHQLRTDGESQTVSYDERLDYCQLVKQTRLAEFDKQIDAIRRGLQSVLSKHVFYILTWNEFEYKICGVPKISVEDLKMSIEYEDDLSYQDDRVRYFWEAISNFTNDERSKFVRFVTGRKRLPVKIYFSISDQPPTSFPDSSTCNCSIYFPNYPSAQIAEEKLRYAIQNCVAIDTDCSSYDEL